MSDDIQPPDDDQNDIPPDDPQTDDDPPPPPDEDPTPEKPPHTENGLRAFETVWRFLEEDDWHPRRIGEQYIYHVQFAGKNGSQNGYAIVRTDLEQFLYYAVAPIKMPEEVRNSIAEFLTRANYGLRIGNFELDYGDGEVRYKSSLDFEGTELQPQMIRTAVYPAVQTLDRYMPGLMRVAFGGSTPVEAIREIEQNDD